MAFWKLLNFGSEYSWSPTAPLCFILPRHSLVRQLWSDVVCLAPVLCQACLSCYEIHAELKNLAQKERSKKPEESANQKTCIARSNAIGNLLNSPRPEYETHLPPKQSSIHAIRIHLASHHYKSVSWPVLEQRPAAQSPVNSVVVSVAIGSLPWDKLEDFFWQKNPHKSRRFVPGSSPCHGDKPTAGMMSSKTRCVFLHLWSFDPLIRSLRQVDLGYLVWILLEMNQAS